MKKRGISQHFRYARDFLMPSLLSLIIFDNQRMNDSLNLLLTLANVATEGYVFSWLHILVALFAVIIIFNLIAFHIGLILKVIIATFIVLFTIYLIGYI